MITALTLAFALGSPVLAQKEESTTEKVKDAARVLLGEKKEAQEQRAKVKITEGSLDMPNRFTAGEITFAVTDSADEKRGFQIAGKGDLGEITAELIYGSVSKTTPAKLVERPTSDPLADIRGALRLVANQCGSALISSSWAKTRQTRSNRTRRS